MNTATTMAMSVLPSVASCAIWEAIKLARELVRRRGRHARRTP